MNFSHFAAIVRLRWQITRNQFIKSGKTNRIFSVILLTLAALGSLGAFAFAALGSNLFLAKLAPTDMMYVWDALAGGFLFVWAISLMVELQRSEMLSLRNLLHLPVSLSGAFFLNYASSLVSLTLLLFLPAMLGLALSSTLHFGGRSLVVFPLLASFVLMVAAISYQLRGWLARLMENKRQRGTVIAITTFCFVMLAQAPNLVNMRSMRSQTAAESEQAEAYVERLRQLEERVKSGELAPEAYAASVKSAEEEFQTERMLAHNAETASQRRSIARVNAVLPIGWLPYGASSAAEGAIVAPWLCVLGMSAIGLASLALAYRSTLRVYTGSYNKGYRSITRKSAKTFARSTMLEKNVPLLTDTQSVVALATLRSLLRAPEAKMALLTPLIFTCLFGSMLLTGGSERFPEAVRPWLGVGAIGISLLGMAQITLNMFGLDRHGFRAYVLMPAPRRDILIGKNMGVLPLTATLSALLVVFASVVGRAPWTHVAATLLQIIVAFLIYFTISNFISIVAPIGMAVGTMKPVSMNVRVIVWQFASILLVPIAFIPAASAIAAEQLASLLGGIHGVPIYLAITLVELPLAAWLYGKIVTFEGRILQEREQAILDVVSKVAA